MSVVIWQVGWCRSVSSEMTFFYSVSYILASLSAGSSAGSCSFASHCCYRDLSDEAEKYCLASWNQVCCCRAGQKCPPNPASEGTTKLEGKEEEGKVPLSTLLTIMTSGVRIMTLSSVSICSEFLLPYCVGYQIHVIEMLCVSNKIIQ